MLPFFVRMETGNEPAKCEPRSLKERIREEAKRLGFDEIGFARADLPLNDDYQRYRAFLEAGMHGEMGFLAESSDARKQLDQDSILLGAKSVICLARSYKRSQSDEQTDAPFAKHVARYARGKDYHAFIRKKLRKLADFVRRLGPKIEARPMSDTAPVLERAWAARSGLGFVGKNGLLIVPGVGSMLLLGEVVTTLELPPDEPIAERCGSCTRCLEACPTRAFPRPFVLDPRECIAYWTIEAREPTPDHIRARMGDHLFGCDDCQTACPFNAAKGERAEDSAPFRPLERWRDTTLDTVLDLPSDAWEEFARGTPLRRATLAKLKESAVTVLAGQAGGARISSLAEDHPDPHVREAARRALATSS